MSNSSVNRRNVGIFAHVDAGKTTTTEHILFESGRIRSLGSVDSGTAVTDWLDIEKERGISVRAATTSYEWGGVRVNLIDTPGHVDFLSEVERSLRVMDGAVLIISAVEGVQAQTELIWNALRRLNIPTVLYVNKMDRIGADSNRVLDGIRQYLSRNLLLVQSPVGYEQAFSGVDDLWLSEADQEAQQNLIESVADHDERLLEHYFNGDSLPLARWKSEAERISRSGTAYPVLFGASSRGIGIHALMNAITDYLPAPGGDPEAPISGIVFKIERDKTMGRMAFVRLYEGAMQNRDVIRNHTRQTQEKITQIRRVEGGRSEDVGLLEAGDIAAVCGLTEVRIGDILGSPEAIPEEARLAVPLLTVQAQWENEQDYRGVVQALQELSDEDPLLDVQWLQDERELHVKIMGPIQLEMLTSLLSSRYGLSVTFSQPSVIYKETPIQTAEGYIAYTMPKPCWAILRFLIEPGERGSGLKYSSVVRTEDLLPQYQNGSCPPGARSTPAGAIWLGSD
ncbi:GTP-binding protein [Paenibacillus sp. SN-8-1]|uniref:GTP-binding protein n=1 Tax=Paenibacillus sp. SN-8-1 TaxID=3435409 RepID=UPI003D9A46D4